MRQLEAQENIKDQEDVETAYQKSPGKALTSAHISQNNNEQDTDVTEEPKSLLTSKDDHQEVV